MAKTLPKSIKKSIEKTTRFFIHFPSKMNPKTLEKQPKTPSENTCFLRRFLRTLAGPGIHEASPPRGSIYIGDAITAAAAVAAPAAAAAAAAAAVAAAAAAVTASRCIPSCDSAARGVAGGAISPSGAAGDGAM